MRTRIWTIALAVLLGPVLAPRSVAARDASYVVAVSRASGEDASWKAVVDALSAKHHARVLTFAASPEELLPELRRAMPRYVCFVARPTECGRDFVAQINRLTRRLDDDPYGDVLWGILTGYDAANALRIAQQREPLVIRRVAAGTEIALAACEEGLWYCELNQGKMVRKEAGKEPATLPAPADTTRALVDALNVYQAQLFVTSGHATERDWQIGYRYRGGQFRSTAGQLFGLDTQGVRHPVRSDNPKVYLPVGNCLMGHIDGPDAIALAFLNSAGVCQMAGYTVPTWFGYAGWGLLDYFVEQPGRFTLAEAFHANQQALLHRLATCFPGVETEDDLRRLASEGELSPAARAAGLSWQDARGLVYDRDSFAFYGDPAWEARMAPGPLAWEQSLTVEGDEYRLAIRPLRGAESFAPINGNGSQRGGRPIVAFFPQRMEPGPITILAGAELRPLITERYILVPTPSQTVSGQTYRVAFRVAPGEKAEP